MTAKKKTSDPRPAWIRWLNAIDKDIDANFGKWYRLFVKPKLKEKKNAR